MICLQETKCDEISKELVFHLWGSNDIGWIEVGARNNTRGIITMWRNNQFQLVNSVKGNNFSAVEGVWKGGGGVQVVIVNVYRPSLLEEKKVLWKDISELRRRQNNRVWCMIGDFNFVRRQEERRSLFSASDYNIDVRGFNEFIENSELVDVPMVGRKFTWYKPNGSVKSRIDRVLVSREWLDVWSDCKQFVLSRIVSDYCALVFKVSKVDWGPKPFRSLDAWQSDGRFKDFVRSKWHSYEVQGGGMFVFKEKLKNLKADLKIWNREVFGYVNLEGNKLVKKVQELDARDDESDLNEQGREERRVLLDEYSWFLFKQEAILKQKARH
ncbi:uncharacterized protein [Phaseolus vulgaris]|uniref:uncharacterized protein n=1 Tax=Phaseolus vulgaris TaxID=3885 RepID=UPI0035CA940F